MKNYRVSFVIMAFTLPLHQGMPPYPRPHTLTVVHFVVTTASVRACRIRSRHKRAWGGAGDRGAFQQSRAFQQTRHPAGRPLRALMERPSLWI